MSGAPLALLLALLPLVALVGVVALVWARIPPGDRFLRGFAQLLAEPVIVRPPSSVLTGRFQVHGGFSGRDTSLQMHLKRRKRGRGFLVVSMAVAEVQSLGYEAIERRIRDEPGREALFTLRAHRLLVQIANGWLTAEWAPQDVIVFPGAFDEERWHGVLDAMDDVATLVEGGALPDRRRGETMSGPRAHPSTPRA